MQELAQANRRQRQLELRQGVSLYTLLGLSWVFGALIATGDQTSSLVFQYLFVLLTTTQGMLIFYFHVLSNDKVTSFFSTAAQSQTTQLLCLFSTSCPSLSYPMLASLPPFACIASSRIVFLLCCSHHPFLPSFLSSLPCLVGTHVFGPVWIKARAEFRTLFEKYGCLDKPPKQMFSSRPNDAQMSMSTPTNAKHNIYMVSESGAGTQVLSRGFASKSALNDTSMWSVLPGWCSRAHFQAV